MSPIHQLLTRTQEGEEDDSWRRRRIFNMKTIARQQLHFIVLFKFECTTKRETYIVTYQTDTILHPPYIKIVSFGIIILCLVSGVQYQVSSAEVSLGSSDSLNLIWISIVLSLVSEQGLAFQKYPFKSPKVKSGQSWLCHSAKTQSCLVSSVE